MNLLKGNIVARTRGVCIYYGDRLHVRDIKILNDLKFEESCWCSINLENNQSLLIGAIHRSPSSTEANSKQLINLMNKAINCGKNYTVILGDFNLTPVNWNNWSTVHNINHSEYLFLECLRDNFLHQLIDKPTRHRHGQNANILDLLIVDKPEIVESIEYMNNLGNSNHLALYVTLNVNPFLNISVTTMVSDKKMFKVFILNIYF